LDEFLMKIGGSMTPKDDWYLGMDLLDEFCHFNRSMGMWQPMQINSNSFGGKLREEGRNIKPPIIHHP
jgi:hypothetical protein